MGLTEVVADQPELKMAYTEKKAESVITGLEKPINDYLLMVWAMPESEHRAHWLNELANWIDEVGEIILKPKNRRPMADFYCRILFDEPFGGAALANMMSRVKRLQRHGYVFTTPMSPADLVERLRQFHVSFGRSCADAPLAEDALRNMIGH